MHPSDASLLDVLGDTALRDIKPLPRRFSLSDFPDSHTLDFADDTYQPSFCPSSPTLTTRMQQSFHTKCPPNEISLSYTSMEREDDSRVDGDYFHQQPGNTKKRKVPGPHPGLLPYPSPFLDNDARPLDSGENTTYRHDVDGLDVTVRNIFHPGGKVKLSRALRAHMSNKEILKSRKRRLSDLLGTTPSGDSFTLDCALSSIYLSARSNSNNNQTSGPTTRRSMRRTRRLQRFGRNIREADRTIVLTPEVMNGFTFRVESATSGRFLLMEKEVAALRERIKAEIARKDRSIEVAGQVSGGARRVSTRSDMVPNPKVEGRERNQLKKKKKRAALANASNPHHLRNYVPSRVPHSGQAPPSAHVAAMNAQNLLGPAAERFLSAELAPRRRRKRKSEGGEGEMKGSPLVIGVVPGDEWICPFCEYDLFYGDREANIRRAVRSRKRILSRRRRAREKAAVTASGGRVRRGAGRATRERATTAAEEEERVERDETRGLPSG